MPPQRACDAENQAGNKLSNGPRRAQSKALFPDTPEAESAEYSATLQAYVSCRGYVCILMSARPVP